MTDPTETMVDSTEDSAKVSEHDFVRLLAECEPVLRAYARTILPNWNSVDEALQEASMTMWEKHNQLENAGGFLPWAKAILRFKCLAMAEKMRRERSILSDQVLRLLVDESEPAPRGNDMQQDSVRRALQYCLAQLNDSHRTLVLAPYGTPGRVTRMARSSGKSANAMYKLLGRLRLKIGTCVRNRLASE